MFTEHFFWVYKKSLPVFKKDWFRIFRWNQPAVVIPLMACFVTYDRRFLVEFENSEAIGDFHDRVAPRPHEVANKPGEQSRFGSYF